MKVFANIIFLLALTAFCQNAVGQSDNRQKMPLNPWADSVLQTMDLSSRIDALTVMAVPPKNHSEVAPGHVPGGVILTGTGPVNHGKQAIFWHNISGLKTLVFSYLDPDRGMLIDSLSALSTARVLAAVTEPHLIYETGRTLGRQCRQLGIDGLLPKVQPGDPYASVIYNSWRWSELNQGMVDARCMSLEAVRVVAPDNFVSATNDNESVPPMALLSPENISNFHEMIVNALKNGRLTEAQLEYRCAQILELKAKLAEDRKSDGDMLSRQTREWTEQHNLKFALTAASITVAQDTRGMLPIRNLAGLKIAVVTFGKDNNKVFEDYCDRYKEADHYYVSYYSTDPVFADLWTRLKDYDLVIEAMYGSAFLNVPREGTDSFSIFQTWLNRSGKSVVVWFEDPLLLANIPSLNYAPSMLLTYNDNEFSNALAPQVIFGGADADGTLPVSVDETLSAGTGLMLKDIGRFGYVPPEETGMDNQILSGIDSIAAKAIRQGAMPGCEILVAKDNKVVLQKAYGYQTYDSLLPVTSRSIYDLASLTKVSGALPCLMKLYEEGLFDLDATMGTYLPYFKRGNKKTLTFREILAHQAGLVPWIPYWKTAIKKNGKFKRKTLSHSRTEDFNYEISDGLYLYKDYKQKIFKQIRKSKLGEKKYLYSGLIFYVFPDIIQAITGQQYKDYLYTSFYEPLGASTLVYNPLQKFDIARIVPTEYDSLFRKTQVHGKVHDEGAAMMAGVSSNAGLFADANDLAKLFQMYCNFGRYGEYEFLNEETMAEFTRCQYPENDNRRALGFDRPMEHPEQDGNTAVSVSQQSFGHSGFTGTFAWADPTYNIVYIFLSNRVYPTRNNRKLYDLNIRTNIQQVIYDAMMPAKQE